LNALLLSLATVSYFLGDIRGAIVIAIMVILAITTAFIQEHRSNELRQHGEDGATKTA
jgi:P-type Mg2+ transporter